MVTEKVQNLITRRTRQVLVFNGIQQNLKRIFEWYGIQDYFLTVIIAFLLLI